jgi:hypothetical protein
VPFDPFQLLFLNFLLAHGKHALVVLKGERHDLYRDAQSLFALTRVIGRLNPKSEVGAQFCPPDFGLKAAIYPPASS